MMFERFVLRRDGLGSELAYVWRHSKDEDYYISHNDRDRNLLLCPHCNLRCGFRLIGLGHYKCYFTDELFTETSHHYSGYVEVDELLRSEADNA